MWDWISTPTEKVYSGFPGDTSPEQDIVCNELKIWVEEQGYNPIGEFDDVDMLRYCRARKFEL